jgi:NADH-quinone oxidoreductase subunit L
MYWFNQHILDGIVNGTANLTVRGSHFVYGTLDQKVIDGAVNGSAGLTGLTGGVLRYIQSGNVQRYAAVLFGAVALFVALFALAG